jgi:transcriptional regulator with XRE-family HTH domain
MADNTAVGVKLHEYVAEEIRALLARKRMSATSLARSMQVSQTYVWRRLTGETAFDLSDLEKIAGLLEVEVVDLFPRRRGEATVTSAHPVDVPATNRIVPPRPPSRRDHSRPGGRSAPTGPRRAPRVPRDIAA